jgi:hypothetical protein
VFDGGYVNVDEMIPGNGYWLRSSGSGEISFDNFSFSGSNNSFSYKMKNAHQITIGYQSLYFGTDIASEDILSFTLPPKPPTGAFDIRFSGETKFCGADDCVSEVMSGEQNLVIECDIKDRERWEIVDESSNVVPGWGVQVLELNSDSETFLLRKSASSVSPLIFSLSPAYPNPFNATTTIPFSVVDDQHIISLQIFDITGKLTARILDEKLPIGNHTVQWNTDGFSSGVYFLKMDAGSISQIQKLMFLE